MSKTIPLEYLAQFKAPKELDYLRYLRLKRDNTRFLLGKMPKSIEEILVQRECFSLMNVNVPEKLDISEANGKRKLQLVQESNLLDSKRQKTISFESSILNEKRMVL